VVVLADHHTYAFEFELLVIVLRLVKAQTVLNFALLVEARCHAQSQML
jgi:hypothetical protein